MDQTEYLQNYESVRNVLPLLKLESNRRISPLVEKLGYEQLSDFVKALLRMDFMNKRAIEGQVRALDAEYDQQQREKKK